LLDSSRLFFARIDTFYDVFEGSATALTLVRRQRLIEGVDVNQDAKERLARQFSDTRRFAREWTHASCWNLSEVESAALWRLYVPQSGGVAIHSSFRRLIESVVPPRDEQEPNYIMHIGKISYIDYAKDLIPDGNLFHPFLYKRKSFEHEQEVRAIICNYHGIPSETDRPAGLNVEVDLAKLIAAIHVSPTAPAWFAGLVESVVATYRCNVPVVQSSLTDEPIF